MKLPLAPDLDVEIDHATLAVADKAKVYEEDNGIAFSVPAGRDAEGRQRYRYLAAIFTAAVLKEDGSQGEPVEILPEDRGRTPEVFRARFADDTAERWVVSADSARGTFTWRREPLPSSTAMLFRLSVPRQNRTLQLWHTGKGREITNEAVQNSHDAGAAHLAAPEEQESLHYSPYPRNCFLVRISRPGDLEIEKTERLVEPLPGTPPWVREPDGRVRELAWELAWKIKGSTPVELTVSWGPEPVARDFTGARKLDPVRAGADFGPFFAQMYLGCLPLNLAVQAENRVAPSANVVITQDAHHYRLTWSRDNMWAYEFLSLVDPQGVARLIEDYLALRLYSEGDYAHSADDAEAEILLLAGRHFRLTGDTAYAGQNLGKYREKAAFLLSLRKPGEALPITYGSWDGQGGPCMGKEPYLIAEIWAGLVRLAEIENALGNQAQALQWETAAAEMRIAALRDYRAGGLWNTDRGTFVNLIDYKDPSSWSPREQTWTEGRDGMRETGIARSEFALYETLVPIHLGLLQDEQKIRAAYSWIDSRYSYATGRGGVSFPPHVMQNFMALLDVYERLKHGIPGADRLLQLVLDHALSSGLPLHESLVPTYFGTGFHTVGERRNYPHTHTGRVWDNSPYFGIVLGIHCGLGYDAKGWHVGDPKPLSNYPLTRVENLRHRDARYSITWNGSGRVKQIRLDGARHRSRVLEASTGEHEVRVMLA
jgi:hypothetical protein